MVCEEEMVCEEGLLGREEMVTVGERGDGDCWRKRRWYVRRDCWREELVTVGERGDGM